MLIATGQVIDDLDLALNDVDNLPNLAPIIARRLRPMKQLVLDDNAPGTWITHEFWLSSTAYIGQPGTFKSVNLKHHVDQVVRLRGLDCLWAYCDTHYDPDEPKDLDVILPGIPREQIPIHKRPDEALGALQSFYQEFIRRRDNNLKSENFAVLVIDEFQDTLPKAHQKKALEWIGEIVRGGRKFGMRMLLGLHSPKKGENGMDSSVFWAMTCVVMGMTIADRTVQWPADIANNQKDLLAALDAELARDETARFTAAIVRPASNADLGFKTAQLKRLENRAHRIQPFIFDETPWIETVEAKADAAISDGKIKSFTALCRLLGLHNNMAKDKTTGAFKDERTQILNDRYAQFFE
jgi:hypothetical protein